MQKKRFIELALHGGCSRKLGAGALQRILSNLAVGDASSASSFSTWLDYGRFDFGENALVSNVDLILPMVLSPSDFGEIAVAHVLSDIYAAGAKPLFALNILGISKDIDSESFEITDLLKAASRRLRSRDVALVGGHTMGDQQDFSYGLAAVGIINKDKIVTNDGAKKGDVLVLTKPLGTSLASINWRDDPNLGEEFQDVLEGMKQLNDVASTEMINHGATSCTDITGFGFLGHTHNLLLASKASAVIFSQNLPIYESVRPYIGKTHPTRIWSKNFDYVKESVDFKVSFSPLLENILFDAQVSGGLLITLSPSNADEFISCLKNKNIIASIVGEITGDNVGQVDIA